MAIEEHTYNKNDLCKVNSPGCWFIDQELSNIYKNRGNAKAILYDLEASCSD